MELLHPVFHRRLVRPDLVSSRVVERAPARIHPFGDLVVLGCSFHVRGLLRVDELALEQSDVLGLVELHDVGGPLDTAREHHAHDQHVRVPLEHDVGVDREPDRAVPRDPPR